MAEPRVTSISIDKPIISDEVGFDKGVITFTFDQDITAYSVRCNGVSFDTGISVEDYLNQSQNILSLSQYTIGELSQRTMSSLTFTNPIIPKTTPITAEVDYTELYQEGENRINIYGQSVDGIWSNYNQQEESQILKPPAEEPPPEEPPAEEPPPSNAIYTNFDFALKEGADGDSTRMITYINPTSSTEMTPFDVGQFEIWGYEGVQFKDDQLNSKFYNFGYPSQVLFNFNVSTIANIQTLTFQINSESLGSFYMKYWNFLTNSWDNNTMISAHTIGFYEIKVENVEAYIGDTGYIYILYYGDVIEDTAIDYANLVIERLE